MRKSRLVDLYAVGSQVQMSFDGQSWQTAVVVRHQFPGVWVQTTDGRFWFVTNTRHIRLQQSTP